MPRPKGSKNKKITPTLQKQKKKGWPKGKKRGPRKTLHDLHVQAYERLKSHQSNNNIDYKTFLTGLAKFILYSFNKN